MGNIMGGFDDTAAEHLQDKKKVLPGVICNIVFAGVMAGFFGAYYWGNPDVYFEEKIDLTPLVEVDGTYKYELRCITQDDGNLASYEDIPLPDPFSKTLSWKQNYL